MTTYVDEEIAEKLEQERGDESMSLLLRKILREHTGVKSKGVTTI